MSKENSQSIPALSTFHKHVRVAPTLTLEPVLFDNSSGDLSLIASEIVVLGAEGVPDMPAELSTDVEDEPPQETETDAANKTEKNRGALKIYMYNFKKI